MVMKRIKMKKNMMSFVMKGVIIFSLFFYGIGNTTEDKYKWVYFGKTKDGDHYYDKSSIKKISPLVIEVWTKLKHSNVGKDEVIQLRKKHNMSIDGWEKLDNQTFLSKYDCVNKSKIAKKIVIYNYEMKMLDDLDYQDEIIEKIVPGSIGDLLLKEVCKGKTDRWVYYGKSIYGDNYYDKSSIKNVSSNVIKVMRKVKYSNEYSNIRKDELIQLRRKHHMSIDGWEKLDNETQLLELDCVKNKSKVVKIYFNNYEGKILDGGDNKDTTETIDDLLQKEVCK
jgi:hypothetical protein